MLAADRSTQESIQQELQVEQSAQRRRGAGTHLPSSYLLSVCLARRSTDASTAVAEDAVYAEIAY